MARPLLISIIANLCERFLVESLRLASILIQDEQSWGIPDRLSSPLTKQDNARTLCVKRSKR
jgi:hypothetical protein